jgi:uncharacterized protein (TIGR01244 family)
MDNFRQLSDDIAISGQPSPEDLDSLQAQGFRTVVNLRTDDEPGLLDDEEREVENRGLNYASVPVSPALLDDVAVARFSQELESVDGKPALVHCKSAGRAGMMVLLHMAVQNGWSVQKALQAGKEMGDLAPAETSPYRTFFEDYLRRHSAGER